MNPFVPLLAVPAIVLLAPAAQAQAVFPNGAPVGLVPPPGMEVVQGSLAHFANPVTRSNLMLDFRPEGEFRALADGLTDEALARAGITVTGREAWRLPGSAAGAAEGVIVTGTQADPRLPGRRIGKLLAVAPFAGRTLLVTGNVMPNDRQTSVDRLLVSLGTLAVNPDAAPNEPAPPLPEPDPAAPPP